MSDALSISQAAATTGLSVHALRYFEAEGILLRAVPRNSSGRRQYAPSDIEWLLLCNRFRASGMPLATIIRFADLVRQGPGNEEDRLELLRAHEREVRKKIEALKVDLSVITTKVRAYEDHLTGGTSGSLWDPSR